MLYVYFVSSTRAKYTRACLPVCLYCCPLFVSLLLWLACSVFVCRTVGLSMCLTLSLSLSLSPHLSLSLSLYQTSVIETEGVLLARTWTKLPNEHSFEILQTCSAHREKGKNTLMYDCPVLMNPPSLLRERRRS